MRRPAAVGLAAILAVVGWYALTIAANYQGNWTALFCSGQRWPVPPELGTHTYQFPNSTGYDGQFYRLVAHDPFLSRGFTQYADAPALRWRRILVPGIAWTVALGDSRRIDQTYILTVLLFCGLGAYALARWLALRGEHPAKGLLFLLLPGTLVCIDRMTVDVALYSLLFLCLIWDEEKRHIPLWIGLACCALTRDLGLLVIGGFVLAALAGGRIRRASLLLTSSIPAILWFVFVRAKISQMPHGPIAPEVASWIFSQAGYGIFLRMLHPAQYDIPALAKGLALLLDQVAFTGLVAAVALVFGGFRWRSARALEWIGLLFALLYFAASDQVFWGDLFSWARAYTPLLAALALARPGPLWRWAPLAAVTLRVGLQLGPQMQGIASTLVK